MTNAENQRRYRDRQKSRWADLERRVKRLEELVLSDEDRAAIVASGATPPDTLT